MNNTRLLSLAKQKTLTYTLKLTEQPVTAPAHDLNPGSVLNGCSGAKSGMAGGKESSR
jgi:hypothetical protein